MEDLPIGGAEGEEVEEADRVVSTRTATLTMTVRLAEVKTTLLAEGVTVRLAADRRARPVVGGTTASQGKDVATRTTVDQEANTGVRTRGPGKRRQVVGGNRTSTEQARNLAR